MGERIMPSVEEAAERMRASPETVQWWLREGRLRGMRPGGTKLGWPVRGAPIWKTSSNVPDNSASAPV